MVCSRCQELVPRSRKSSPDLNQLLVSRDGMKPADKADTDADADKHGEGEHRECPHAPMMSAVGADGTRFRLRREPSTCPRCAASGPSGAPDCPS